MNILDKIVAVKREEVAALQPRADEIRRRAQARAPEDHRDFSGGLRAAANRMALIAEIKKASPSAGVIQADFDPVRIAREYESAGATALSVLTDQQFFQGSLEILGRVRAAVRLPVLRKDFIIDDLQLYEAAAAGADAILLIAAILDDAQLRGYAQTAGALGLAALVEVHDDRELDRALEAGATLVGINNRNLKDFSVDLATTERLGAKIRQRDQADSGDVLVVAESGIHDRADVERLAAAGAGAILVGESLMRSGDIRAKVMELIG